jgi:hypothetical protein
VIQPGIQQTANARTAPLPSMTTAKKKTTAKAKRPYTKHGPKEGSFD